MAKFMKHHNEDLDDTRGKWRPVLQEKKTLISVDGLPVDWDEGVVVSCPACGCPFGVGLDKGGPYIVDGKTDAPVRCQNAKCSWADVMEFDQHQDAVGRNHFAKLKAEAVSGRAQARINRVKKLAKAQIMEEADQRALAAAKQIIGNGDAPDAPEVLAQWLKNGGKIK